MILILMFALWGFWQLGLMPLWVPIISTAIAAMNIIDEAYEKGKRR